MSIGSIMQQASLFPTEKRAKVMLAPTESMYWMCTSALQKFIRRGMEDQAVQAARVMYEFNVDGLKRRLLTVSLEDIGLGDWSTVVEVGDSLRPLGKRNKIWTAYEEATRLLSRAVKNRDADDGGNLIYEARAGKISLPKVPDEEELDWLNREWWPRPDENAFEWWTWAEDRAQEKGRRCFENVRWLRSFTSTLRNHPGLCAGLLIYRWDSENDALRPPVGVKVDPNIRSGMRYLDDEGFFPDMVMDGHTRAGKVVFGKLQKEFGLPQGSLHLHQFFSDGAKLDRWAHWTNDYRSFAAETFFPAGRVEEIQDQVGEKLYDLRRWAFKKIVLDPHFAELSK